MKYEQSLASVLAALSGDIAPNLTSAKARSSLLCIQEAIVGIILSREGDGAAANQHDDPSLADGFFGGADSYERRAAQFSELVRTKGTAGGCAEMAAALAWERSAVDAVQARRVALNLPAGDGGGAASVVSPAALEAYLRGALPGSREISVTAITPFVGGQSKFTALVEATGSTDLPPRFVFRQDKAINTSGGPSVIGEFALLRKLHEYGVRVPAQFHLETSPEPLGLPFLMTELLEGSPASGLLTPPFSASVALQLARELGRLHSIPKDNVAGALESTAAPQIADFIAELDGFAKLWQTWPRPYSLGMTFALQWLRDNIELAVEGPATVIHRDSLFHNVLAKGDQLTAILDWEFARIGYPAEDLGWIQSAVEGAVPWADFMAAYESTRGTAISERQQDFYAVWGSVRLAAMIAYNGALIDDGVLTKVDSIRCAVRDTYLTQQWLSHHLARVISRQEKLETKQ